MEKELVNKEQIIAKMEEFVEYLKKDYIHIIDSECTISLGMELDVEENALPVKRYDGMMAFKIVGTIIDNNLQGTPQGGSLGLLDSIMHSAETDKSKIN